MLIYGSKWLMLIEYILLLYIYYNKVYVQYPKATVLHPEAVQLMHGSLKKLLKTVST